MKYVSMTCPNCGAATNINAEKGSGFCEYCGSPLILDDEKPEVKLTLEDAEDAGYQFEKGRQRAQQEAQRNTRREYTYEDTTVTLNQPLPKKKRKTWLWVLGWIFIFPIPLTILIWRSQKMSTIVKIVLTAVAWLVYMSFGSGSASNHAAAAVPSTSDPAATSEIVIPSVVSPAESNTESRSESELAEVFLPISSEAT